ncbi:SdrD B-like domain-containing protein, partial [Haloferula sp. A504]|uniref:SdrD B-like domain-containing protein n=1 Tax=Haloferula sp. A504 TaxID=3373601 RepID=UPI0031C7E66A|nr:carboxypeptidase regulatory-like domain-containing protein [Verrucomicrobiaceae bacterium E54]
MSPKINRSGGQLLFPSLLLSLCFAVLSPAVAQNPPPTQVFYIPFSEDDQLAGFDAINSVAGDPLAVFVTFSTVADDTVIYYDHWEDGYEADITNPVQATTRIYGDGDPSNGYPPGNAADLIAAGTVFDLRNFVETTTLGEVVDFDARDKVASFKPISLTKTCFPAGTNTLLAGCVEIFEYGLWGTEYRVPVGEDMPTSTASGNLTFDEDCFSYVAVSISAGRKGASVQIDKDNDGTFEENVVLAEGQTAYYEGIDTGARILSDHPVQAVLFTGTVGSNYASRDTMLLPTYRWASDYYAPVTTGAGGGTVTFLYNPGASPITVAYDYRDSDSSYVTGTVSVPAGGNARVVMSEGNGSTHFGAYRFYTTGADPDEFYAVSTIDADDAAGNNQAWDGGFTLVGRPSLTTQALVSLGIGRDPYSDVNPNENGNPVWMTTVGNGDTPARVYVDYNGDNAGSLTDPNGNNYDVHYDVRELVQLKLFDPDGNQSGMLIYTLDPAVRIAAVWGQDPAIAQGGQPGLDVAALVPPLREGASGKQALLGDDVDGDGQISAGDVLDYRIRTVNTARTSIPGPFTVTDNLPADVTYVPGSARYRFLVGGVWQGWISLPDDGSGTAFPLDGAGYAIVGSLGVGEEVEVSFEAAVSPTPASGSLVNTGEVEISPYGLVIPIESKDILYGTLGDRVWNDVDGDGVQDAGEPGLNGVTVWADLDGNGAMDPGEPSDVTAGDGDYLLTGLTGGSYVVRVSPADIAALDPRFGPSVDLDGTTTPHEATAALAVAADRTDVDFGYKIGASVGDRVWADFNGNGVQEAGEPGINGVRVYLDLNGNNGFDSGEPFSVTFGDGSYFIGNLDPGTYEVRVDTGTLPAGATQTHDLNGTLDHEGSVSLSGVEHRDDLDFGYRGSLSMGGLVWEDLDGDGLVDQGYDIYDGRIDINNSGGVGSGDDGFLGGYEIIDGYVDITGNGSISSFDDGSIFGFQVIDGGIDVTGNGAISGFDDLSDATPSESGIANVRVYIDSNGNGGFDANEPSDVTDGDGLYSIGNLFDGDYLVRVDASTVPASYVQTYDLTDPLNDATAEATLSGSSRTDVDFGYRNDATLGDLVWNDRDGDGVRDPGEPGIEGVLVYIDADNDNRFDQGVETLTYTDVDGLYRFENLADGTYSVRIEISTLPQGASQTYDLNGGLDHEASRTLGVSEDAIDVDFGYTANASFGDIVWTDTDGDGVQDGGESGISGVTVYLDINGNGVFDPASEPSGVTDGSGGYLIGNLVPGIYTARVDPASLPPSSVPTHDLSGALDNAATFSLSANQARTDVDFGYSLGASIGDFVWEDADGNGVQDSGEPGLGGVQVTLFNAVGDGIVATTTTAADGSYDFSGLLPGTYYLGFAAASGYERTRADQGTDSTDSDAVAGTGRTADFSLTSGETNDTLDAGYYQTGSIGDFVWEDLDADGVQDGGESGLNNVTVELFRPGFGPDGLPGNGDDDDPVATTTSGVDGAYGFPGLAPGDYVVGFAAVGGHLRSPEGAGSADTDSDAGADGTTATVTVISGQDITDIDAGYVPAGAVSGTVRVDIDNDDLPEQPLAGVTLTLKDASGGDIDSDPGTPGVQPTTAVTNADGEYIFGGLLPGDYRVVETDPSGFISVNDVDGANNNIVGDETPITVVAGETNAGNDFLDEQLNTISGSVLADTTGNGAGDTGIAGVVVTLTDGAGVPIDGDSGTPGVQPITALTNGSGAYVFTGVPPGIYGLAEAQPTGYATVTDGDTTSPADDAANADATDDFIPVSVFNGENDTGNDFVEVPFGSIAGTVWADIDGNGTGDTGISGVLLGLLDALGGPVLVGGNPVTTTTLADGSYSFIDLLPGDYQVAETQPSGYGSVSDVDGGDPDLIGNVTAISVAPGQDVGGRDFVEVEFGTISGHVFVGSDPLAGVTLTLLDEFGDPVDGDPGTPGVQPITTTTGPGGSYRFENLPPGTYQVGQTQPQGYDSFGDVDGGDLDIIGDITPIVIAPGEESP